jgi:hypothetical protein
MNQPKLQAMRQQKQMSSAGNPPPFTIDMVITQSGILQGALTQAFADGAKYVTDLKAQLAAGTPVTQAQLDQLGNQFAAMTTATQAFDVANTEPVAPIAPLPPVAPAGA